MALKNGIFEILKWIWHKRERYKGIGFFWKIFHGIFKGCFSILYFGRIHRTYQLEYTNGQSWTRAKDCQEIRSDIRLISDIWKCRKIRGYIPKI